MNENTNRCETSLPLKGNFVLHPDIYNELCRALTGGCTPKSSENSEKNPLSQTKYICR